MYCTFSRNFRQVKLIKFFFLCVCTVKILRLSERSKFSYENRYYYDFGSIFKNVHFLLSCHQFWVMNQRECASWNSDTFFVWNNRKILRFSNVNFTLKTAKVPQTEILLKSWLFLHWCQFLKLTKRYFSKGISGAN